MFRSEEALDGDGADYFCTAVFCGSNVLEACSESVGRLQDPTRHRRTRRRSNARRRKRQMKRERSVYSSAAAP